VSCEVRGKTFFIECKRPLTARGVKGRITDAAAMLPDRIDATGGQALGVIALSLTRRLNLGDKLRVYRGEVDGKEKLSRALRPPRRSRAQIGNGCPATSWGCCGTPSRRS